MIQVQGALKTDRRGVQAGWSFHFTSLILRISFFGLKVEDGGEFGYSPIGYEFGYSPASPPLLVASSPTTHSIFDTYLQAE